MEAREYPSRQTFPIWLGCGKVTGRRFKVDSDLVPSPHGFPLSELADLLAKLNSIEISREGDVLEVLRGGLKINVEVLAPPSPQRTIAKISSVVTVKSSLNGDLGSIPNLRGVLGHYNRMATLGSLTEDQNDLFIGSRLTVFEGENVWSPQMRLVLAAIMLAPKSMRRVITESMEHYLHQPEDSSWPEADFVQAHANTKQHCVCTVAGKQLTAEFPVRFDASSAAVRQGDTALWQINGEQSHPGVGGGLCCQVRLPYEFHTRAELDDWISHLNRMEMASNELPPHFGAWCRGDLGNKPIYVSFLPDALHEIKGIATSASLWAMQRAEWASAMLAPYVRPSYRRRVPKTREKLAAGSVYAIKEPTGYFSCFVAKVKEAIRDMSDHQRMKVKWFVRGVAAGVLLILARFAVTPDYRKEQRLIDCLASARTDTAARICAIHFNPEPIED